MTKTEMTDLKQLWSEQEASSGKSVVKRRIESISGLNCFIGLIGATGARMFQMELDASAQVHFNFLRKFRGVEIQAIPFRPSHTEFTIILLEKELTDIFTMFIDDIVEKLKAVEESQHALTVINQRVNYWRKLFARVTGELLSAGEQRGLFGELYFLKVILQKSAVHKEVINSWRGSESANQDFARNGTSVEIKTTKANNPSIHISNEMQLDFTVWDRLFLGVISVTETTGNQNSLSRIIEEIREMIHHDSELVQEFETKLENAGVSREMIDSYNEISYSAITSKFYLVQDEFPVILKGNLISEAIYEVKYQIDISSCGSFEVPEADVIRTMI